MNGDDGARACAERIAGRWDVLDLVDDLGIKAATLCIEEYRDRAVAAALAEHAAALKLARELWQAAEYGIDGLRQRYNEQAARAYAAEAGRDAALRALRAIVDEAGDCAVHPGTRKCSAHFLSREPCCIEGGRAALRADGA